MPISSTLHSQFLVSPQVSNTPNTDSTPVRIGVLASGNGSNFEALIQAIADGLIQAEIPIVVYNNSDAAVAARAQRWGISAVLLDHRQYQSREAFDFDVAQTLVQFGVEWIVMAGWMRRVTSVLLDRFESRAINIHPSLLPSFPGTRAIKQAITAGVKITGCTAHMVTLDVDAGPILIQSAVPVLPNDTVKTLHARIQVQEHVILPRAVKLAISQ